LGEGLKKLAQRTKKRKRDRPFLSGTSEFDPVLAEICYRWFGIENGEVLDPFAGGIVRGAVAGVLNQKYTGIDMSDKQIKINKEKAEKLKLELEYIKGNSLNILDEMGDRQFDFILSCPPYYNLEKYNDGEGDLSMKDTYDDFLLDYKSIIKKSVDRLKDNRFAVFIVGNMRDAQGYYRDFVSDTIRSFEDSGAKFYNDIILVNMIITASIRSRRPFERSRKVARVHQNILAFYKGNTDSIKKSIEQLPKIEKYHDNVIVFYKGDIDEIKKNYKIVNKDIEYFDDENKDY